MPFDDYSSSKKYSGEIRVVTEPDGKCHIFTVGDIYEMHPKKGVCVYAFLEALVLPNDRKYPPKLYLRIVTPAAAKIGAALEHYAAACSQEEREQLSGIGLSPESFGRIEVSCIWFLHQNYIVVKKAANRPPVNDDYDEDEEDYDFVG